MQAVIMAGGKGTRLSSVAKDIPKPMVRINGKPVLEYQIENLREFGITDIFLVTGHLAHVISDYFGDGTQWDVNITYFEETTPLGTAGALAYLRDTIDDNFLLIMGDLFLQMDFRRFYEFHQTRNAGVSLFVHPNAHPYDSDILMVDKDSKVTGFLSKHDERKQYYKNIVNAGVYMISRKMLDYMTKGEKCDLDKELIFPHIQDRNIYAYHSTEYVKDIGTPERLEAVEEDIRRNVPQSRKLSNKQKCIFLDRDGTINKYKGFLTNIDEFELEDYVSEAIKLINTSQYLAVIASNQPVVARGECTFDELEMIHSKMETLLGDEGAFLDGVYYCPHHTDKGFPGEVPELKFHCKCRKPKTGMLEQAAKDMNIDLAQSWFIGDTTVDIQTGKNAGMKTCLVMTGETGKDNKYPAKPDLSADNLFECVKKVLGE